MKLTEIIQIRHKHEFVLEQKVRTFTRSTPTTIAVGESYKDQDGLFVQDILVPEQELTIFLDIDGVVLPFKDDNQEVAYEHVISGDIDKIKLDSECCKRIISVVEDFGAKIRVHSNWRRHPLASKIILDVLLNNGFKKEHLSMVMPICRFRGMSSDRWSDIGASGHLSFASVIIEDTEAPTDFWAERQIKPDDKVGFSANDESNLRRLLQSRIVNHLLLD